MALGLGVGVTCVRSAEVCAEKETGSEAQPPLSTILRTVSATTTLLPTPECPVKSMGLATLRLRSSKKEQRTVSMVGTSMSK